MTSQRKEGAWKQVASREPDDTDALLSSYSPMSTTSPRFSSPTQDDGVEWSSSTGLNPKSDTTFKGPSTRQRGPTWRSRGRSRMVAALVVMLVVIALSLVETEAGEEAREFIDIKVEDTRSSWSQWSGSWQHGEGGLETSVDVFKEVEGIDRTGDTIPVSTSPRRQNDINKDDNTRYIGYLPHSGFHNQRSELNNALLLGKILNRTVLLPPIWVGWPTATAFYHDLQEGWTTQLRMSPHSFGLANFSDQDPLNAPDDFPSISELYPLSDYMRERRDNATRGREMGMGRTHDKWLALGYEVRPDGYPVTNLTAAECKSYSPECRHTYRDTFLAWDFLADLAHVEKAAKVVHRWDIRERAVMDLLHINVSDVLVFDDVVRYDLKFMSNGDHLVTDDITESHWARQISIPEMQKLSQKLLLVGSLFGTGRIYFPTDTDAQDREMIDRSLAFRSPWLIDPADAIRDRLGGPRGYVGVHARIGDGGFARHAKVNMEHAWRTLVGRLRISQAAVDEMWEEVKPDEPDRKRSLSDDTASTSNWSHLDDDDGFEPVQHLNRRSLPSGLTTHSRRAFSGLLIKPKLDSVRCRGELHTRWDYRAFNAPLYLATDAKDPSTDPHLAIFYRSFPCVFTLSDFDRPTERNEGQVVESVGDMLKLVNEQDGVPLGRLLLPFLEAVIAAKGQTTVGTSGSTFSTFAQGALHRAYKADRGL